MPKKPYPSQIAPKPKNPVLKTIGVMGPAKNKRMGSPIMAAPMDSKLNVKKTIGAMGTKNDKRMVGAQLPMSSVVVSPFGIMGSTQLQRQNARNAALKQMAIKNKAKKYNG